MSPQVCASSSSSGSNSPPGGDEWTAQPLSSPLHTVADISCKSSGSFPSYEVTFHVPRASLSIQRSGFRGLHLLSAANPLCTGPSWFPCRWWAHWGMALRLSFRLGLAGSCKE
ncbi:hypothetical protein GOODEAATRI_032400 [Goodea atripinnis]|uniref:Uncharacterized protein n=1 Tax=Goodea atripinnis TaxID=208336 RepID=A0ABV0PJA9_9TELE